MSQLTSAQDCATTAGSCGRFARTGDPFSTTVSSPRQTRVFPSIRVSRFYSAADMRPKTQAQSLRAIPKRRDRRHCTGRDLAAELIRTSFEVALGVGDGTDRAAQNTCCRRHRALCDLSRGRAPGLEQKSTFAENDQRWFHIRVRLGGRVGRPCSRPVSLRLSGRCAKT